LTFPSICSNLEELIIMDNWPGLEVLPEVDPRLLKKLREQTPPYSFWYRNWGKGELKNKPTLQERRMYWKELEIPRPKEPVQPPVFDLSGLDGCPRLRVFKIARNHFGKSIARGHFGKSGVILPSRCSALEAVLLNETKVEEWRLEGSPKIRLVKLEIPDYDYGRIDLSPLLAHFKSPRKPPLISIEYKIDENPEYVIKGYDKFPKRVKERMIIMCTSPDIIHFYIPPFRFTNKIWQEYLFLLGVYGVVSLHPGWTRDKKWQKGPFRPDLFKDYGEWIYSPIEVPRTGLPFKPARFKDYGQ
jgi:hypothetical protein